ncbi:MAG: SRPBCC family protein [Nocardioides sp.]|jgi:hypothetical protein
MKIANEFTVSAPIDKAWALLTDIEEVAPCLPGATLTGREGDTYTGKIKVKVGPVLSEFTGTAGFAEKDDVARRAVIDAKGKDTRGSGNAAALITVQLRAEGERTVANVDTDLMISGKLAQFGSGMIQQVSEKLLGQFVESLEGKLSAGGVGTLEPVAEPVAVPVAEPVASVASELAADPSGLRQPPPAQEQEPLDLMALAGGAVLKRVVPLVAVVVALVALVIFLVVR